MAFILIIIALAARVIPGPRTIDDAYITYRYARNILNENGFVYNPGEHVQGTTTPLYTFLMVSLGSLTGKANAPFPEIALSINIIADIGTCLLLWKIGKKVGHEIAGAAAGVLWGIAPYSVTFAIGGLETSVYVFLLTGIIAAYLWKNYTIAMLFSSLAILTRPDALILVIPLLIDRFYRAFFYKETLKVSEIIAFIAPLLIWEIFAFIYFGSIIPHSVRAKLDVYRLSPGESFIRLLQHYATPFFEYNWGGKIAVGIGLILYPFLYFIGAINIWRAEKRLLVWMIYPWLYMFIFALANPLIFRWYLTPPLAAYFFFILVGAEIILKSFLWYLRERISKHYHPRLRITNSPVWVSTLTAVLIICLPLFSTSTEWIISPDHGASRPAPSMAYIKLELLYKRAVEIIGPELNSQSVLAAGDVGVLGYSTSARILDTVGLNSPISLKYYPIDKSSYVINYAIPASLITDQRPDWLIFLEIYGRKTLLENRQFLENYQLVTTLPTDIYGSDGMLIFKKRTSPANKTQ